MKKQRIHVKHPSTDSTGPGQKTVAVYARIDSDDSYMLKAQIRELAAYAAAHPDFTGWSIVTYQDTGSFSQSGTPPQLEQLLSDIRSGTVQCVIIKNLSRFARDLMALSCYLEHIFFACRTRLIVLTEHLDTYDPDTLILLRNTLSSPQK